MPFTLYAYNPSRGKYHGGLTLSLYLSIYLFFLFTFRHTNLFRYTSLGGLQNRCLTRRRTHTRC